MDHKHTYSHTQLVTHAEYKKYNTYTFHYNNNHNILSI